MAANQTLKLNAEPRVPGKATSRELRAGWYVPAVVYGPKTKSLSLSIHVNDALKYGKRGFENSIFTLESKDSTLNGLKVLRKTMDVHPVTRRPTHVDFFAPDMTQKVRVDVEVRITGKAKGTADGGLVSMVRRNVEVECLPLEIPEFFELDITEMGLNESMHVSDIKFPENVKVITSTDETIVSCAEVKEEVIAAPTADAAAAAAPGAEGAAAAAPGAAPAAGAAAPQLLVQKLLLATKNNRVLHAFDGAYSVKLIVGLGNPGPNYQLTRHNIGFLFIDALVEVAGGGRSYKSEFKAETQKIKFADDQVIVCKPQTFMNLSGESVQPLLKFYNLEMSDLLVVHDEVDQPFGALKFQIKRGHGEPQRNSQYSSASRQ